MAVVDGALLEAEALLVDRLATVSLADLAMAMDGPGEANQASQP